VVPVPYRTGFGYRYRYREIGFFPFLFGNFPIWYRSRTELMVPIFFTLFRSPGTVPYIGNGIISVRYRYDSGSVLGFGSKCSSYTSQIPVTIFSHIPPQFSPKIKISFFPKIKKFHHILPHLPFSVTIHKYPFPQNQKIKNQNLTHSHPLICKIRCCDSRVGCLSWLSSPDGSDGSIYVSNHNPAYLNSMILNRNNYHKVTHCLFYYNNYFNL
jgi:hypothetical protein